jgi:hypothetical protein
VVKDAVTAQPLPGCAITLVPSGATAVTGTDGVFLFENIAPDTYSIEVSSNGYYANSKNVTLEAGYTLQVDILLTTVASSKSAIHGTVKDAETTRPLAGCAISLTPTGASTVTGTDGTFRFENIASNTYSVSASAYGYYESTKSVTVTAGQTMSVDFLLAKYDANDRIPTLGAIRASELTHNTARLEGEVLDGGSSSVTERGFLYSELPNPTFATANKMTLQGGTGLFSTTITGLRERTTYYAVAYAINSRGTAYSTQTQFQTTDATQITTPSNVIFVAVSGNDANDGSSWLKAKKTISAAVESATEGKQIWVSAGTYEETLIPKNGIPVYGGFSGTETSIEGRTLKTNIRGVSYSYQEYTEPTIINGFLITSYVELSDYEILENCIISGSTYYYSLIRVGATSIDAVISNCVIENNHTPNGLIECNYAKLTMVNCYIRGNIGGYHGRYVGEDLKMYNCVITNNSASFYGLYPEFYNCTFANNISMSIPSDSKLYNCVLWNNNKSSSGQNVAQSNANWYSCIEVTTADNTGVRFKKPSTKQGRDATDWQTADWSITSGSTCINAGLSLYYPIGDYPKDIAGNPRINGTSIDVGAYEY